MINIFFTFDVWIVLLSTLLYAISLYHHQSMCCIHFFFFLFFSSFFLNSILCEMWSQLKYSIHQQLSHKRLWKAVFFLFFPSSEDKTIGIMNTKFLPTMHTSIDAIFHWFTWMELKKFANKIVIILAVLWYALCVMCNVWCTYKINLFSLQSSNENTKQKWNKKKRKNSICFT